MKKDRERRPAGMQMVVAGLMVIALALLLQQTVRIFHIVTRVEIISLTATLTGWLLVLTGSACICRVHPAFARAMLCAGVVLLVLAIEAATVAVQLKQGMGTATWVQFSVILEWYLGMMGLCYVYHRLLYGAAMLIKPARGDRRKEKLYRACYGRGRASCILIIACCIGLPVTATLQDTVHEYVAGALVVMILALQMRMCALLMSAYDRLRGKGRKQ